MPLGNEPFGLFTFRAPEGLLWRKWRGVERQMQEKACWTSAGPMRATCPPQPRSSCA